MRKFVLHEIEAVKGKQAFFEVEIDGIKQLDAFEEALKNTTYSSELKTILTYMEYVANNRALPHTKFKDITPAKERVKEYEFKSKHLRVYAIHQKGGKVIVLCGFKNNQKKDITKFRSLKRELLVQLDKQQ